MRGGGSLESLEFGEISIQAGLLFYVVVMNKFSYWYDAWGVIDRWGAEARAAIIA